MKRTLLAVAFGLAAVAAQADSLSTQTGTVGPLITGTEVTPMGLTTGYKAFAGDLVEFVAAGPSGYVAACAVYDFWVGVDGIIWQGWSDETPLITIPHGALWSMACVAEPQDAHYIVDNTYLLAAVKHIPDTFSLSASGMALESDERSPIDPAIAEALYKFMEQ